jgi:hypothetical protein
MSHMGSYGSNGSGCADSGCSGGARIVTYTATGLEANSGLDFFVPITDEDGDAVTLASDDYEVGFFGIAGSTTLPMPDFPTGVGDRTTTQFRVQVNVAPTVGDVWKFQIVE